MIPAFLPVEEVVPSFVSLPEHTPDGLELVDFLDYFESTWIQGVSTSRRSGSARYPPSSWNCVERTMTSINRTNAVTEVFNREFAAKVGQANPTIWNFMAAMFVVQSDTDSKMLKESVGDLPPPRKKRQVMKNRRLQHAVSKYDPEATTLIEFLDKLRDICDKT